MLERAMQIVKTRLQECVAQEGQHLINIIFQTNLKDF